MVSAVSSVAQTYAVYYRQSRNTSLASVASVAANSLEDAEQLSRSIVASRYPEGCVLRVSPAKESPWPVLDANGNLVAPSRS